MSKKFNHATRKDEPGLALTRTIGNLDRDSIYIGDDLKVSVIGKVGKEIRLKFFFLNNQTVNIERAERREYRLANPLKEK